MTWRKGVKTPPEVLSGGLPCASVDSNALYIKTQSNEAYAYASTSTSWSRLPKCPTKYCPAVILNNLLTLVGGNHEGIITNQLFSLTGAFSDRKWTEEFPPMPTKRQAATALCTGTHLIVAGGKTN